MRGINLGSNPDQYYPARVPKAEALARLLVSTAVSFSCVPIQMTKRDIASDCRLLRLRPSLSLLMCAELPGVRFNVEFDLVLFYLVMPFGRNGAPATARFQATPFRQFIHCEGWTGQIGSLPSRSCRDYMSMMGCSLN